MCQLFRPQKSDTSITSLDFDDPGELLLAATDDETIQIYNCKEGKHVKTLFSKKYGVHLARFTHHSQSVLYSSTKVDDTIRYLSTHDNQFIRYFKGHTAPVTSLVLSPASDTFLSCSMDNTVKLWSLSTPNPTGTLLLNQPYLSAFDPSGSVLAIASPGTSSILMYDVRNYDKAPFATFDMLPHEETYMPGSAGRDWTSLEFANDGKSMLLATASAGHFLLDAFSGDLKAFCARKTGSTGRLAPGIRSNGDKGGVQGQGDVCFSPDGRYLIGGAGQENLYVWDAQAAERETTPSTRTVGPTHELECKSRAAIVAFNPRLHLCASADKEVVFWVPEKTTASSD